MKFGLFFIIGFVIPVTIALIFKIPMLSSWKHSYIFPLIIVIFGSLVYKFKNRDVPLVSGFILGMVITLWLII